MDKINLKRSHKYVVLWNLSIYYTWKNIKKSYKNKFKISTTTWNDKFEIFKTGFSMELWITETIKLLGSTKSNITKDENGENVPHLEITEGVLVHCNIVNNNDQQDSRVLYTFVPNKSFGQFLDISPKKFIFLETFNSEFSYIEVWFTDQNSRPLEIEDKISITLVINLSVKSKK